MGLGIGLIDLVLRFIRPFSVFTAKFIPQFSPELCKLEYLNMVDICRMSYCIVQARHRVIALIFLIFIRFSFFPKTTS